MCARTLRIIHRTKSGLLSLLGENINNSSTIEQKIKVRLSLLIPTKSVAIVCENQLEKESSALVTMKSRQSIHLILVYFSSPSMTRASEDSYGWHNGQAEFRPSSPARFAYDELALDSNGSFISIWFSSCPRSIEPPIFPSQNLETDSCNRGLEKLAKSRSSYPTTDILGTFKPASEWHRLRPAPWNHCSKNSRRNVGQDKNSLPQNTTLNFPSTFGNRRGLYGYQIAPRHLGNRQTIFRCIPVMRSINKTNSAMPQFH